MEIVKPYIPVYKVRIVTAASLFDGHDAAINIMRRILQGMGTEVIHLGHNRSVEEVVTAALQEDVQGIAISSYQGGHVEYFKYISVSKPKTTSITEKLISSIEKGQLLSEEQSNNN